MNKVYLKAEMASETSRAYGEAHVVGTQEATCTKSAKGAILDYFMVSERLGHYVKQEPEAALAAPA